MKKTRKVEYPLACDTWGNEEVAAIDRVVKSNRYTMGSEVKKFEEEFAAFHGSKFGVMTNSGSSANLIMLAALSLHPKFKRPEKKGLFGFKKKQNKPNIIVPAVSWSTTYFPVNQHGYRLKFVDVDPVTFNIDPLQVAMAIDEDTVAVLAVNLLGNPCELDKLSRICDVSDVILLEDNCESMGASLNDKLCGTWGKMGTFSFFFSHHLQTCEGGMVLTDDEDLVDYLRSLRAHGWTRDVEFGSFETTGNAFEDSFNFVLPGYCVRPLEFSGATGQEQLKKWPSMLEFRQSNAKVAKEVFNTDKIKLQSETGQSSWFGFGLILKGKLAGQRKEVISKLVSLGVECRPIVAGNFQKNPVIGLLDTIPCDAPNADMIDNDGFFIGNDSQDLEEKIRLIARIINEMK